ncbi:MAG: hypothetical protein Q9159_001868 [Coniocarpon cinnabarinum]
MPRGLEGNEVATPRPTPKASKPPPSLSKSDSRNQKSLLGFFQKQPQAAQQKIQQSSKSRSPAASSPAAPAELTPAPSSGAPEMSSPTLPSRTKSNGPVKPSKNTAHGPQLPISPASSAIVADAPAVTSSPSRKAKKKVSYAESDLEDEDEDGVFRPTSGNRRSTKRRKIVHDDESDDEFGMDDEMETAMADEDDMEDFVAPDDSGEEKPKPQKRKRPSKAASPKSKPPAAVPKLEKIPTEDMEIPETSTARQWEFDAEHPEASQPRKELPKSSSSEPHKRGKAHMKEPEQRHAWLANEMDIDRRPPTHPEYDPRTLYIPPMAFNKFSPFEKQYWEIKQKFWDTIVFFKKGKFYELYEKDATVGSQLFDLKLTDRVNMRMVGVPEATLDHWAAQFIAKGYKVARVDQMETALGKEMRERDDPGASKKAVVSKKPPEKEKVIRRELASVLTAATLVDGGMLTSDMSTWCCAIKEIDQDDLPHFGIAFVDTATAHFHLTTFTDDADMTKFETFVAQIRPGELLLEKSCLSAHATRILKANTGPTTIWNYLKPGKEFWPADITCREIEACDYFIKEEDSASLWPKALEQAKDNDLIMSAFGALVQYLRVLKIERDLISLGNITWYDPIKRGSTLVLDGQSLINLEVFANSFDGGTDGTLFEMLNRCVTPFGKRMLRQWLCHPLADANKINARLDAVDALNATSMFTDKFTSSLTKMPDLERLISRVHAKRCRAMEFVKVLEGFEQIEYTMSLLTEHGKGDGLIGQLVASIPDLSSKLEGWKNAFDRNIAKSGDILVPELGIEEDFDESNQRIKDCEEALDELLNRARKQLGSNAIKFTDVGKEIYQLEVPVKIKNVPSSWSQMSSTASVKRYYNPELRRLVRDIQEARETHAQIIREVAGRFYTRFDEDYAEWLAAVRIIAHLDCLISLARASRALGEPSCRPVFVDDDHEDAASRGVLDFHDLRHPTMLTSVRDFIPNNVTLGGPSPNLNLLTGANAAGKSTVLRMTCIAVILAQLGCYVPATSATLTPRDRIMSRLGANDNIMQAQSTFFVELAETKKILNEATPRSLVILDELGRGTSSVDGLAVADAVLHHIAGHVGCLGFFATHYHSLATSYSAHPEVAPKRMAIDVDDAERRITFLYKLEDGVAEGSFGMHCASMCGIPKDVVERAEEAAGMWEHSARVGVREREERENGEGKLGLGWWSDVAWLIEDRDGEQISERAVDVLARAVENM